jgi:MSHA biogenesis protein MshM
LYLDHFGLSELPFGITPDTSYTVITRSHQAALNTLLVALNSGEGFIKITGEVGTGKSLLCRRLLQALPENSISAYLPNPYLAPRTLLLALAEELGWRSMPTATITTCCRASITRCWRMPRRRRQVVVCIDEAQAMPLETLESCACSPIWKPKSASCCRSCCSASRNSTASWPSRRCASCCSASPSITGWVAWAARKSANYLAHRLRVAGYRGEDVFGPRAVRCLHRASRGTPRLLNILAHKSLLAVYGEGKHAVRPSHVRQAAGDTEGASRRVVVK